jgi:hypothetical protein
MISFQAARTSFSASACGLNVVVVVGGAVGGAAVVDGVGGAVVGNAVVDVVVPTVAPGFTVFDSLHAPPTITATSASAPIVRFMPQECADGGLIRKTYPPILRKPDLDRDAAPATIAKSRIATPASRTCHDSG